MSTAWAKEIQRTGPVVLRDCGSCEGVGKEDCLNCHGTGRISVDIRPFVTLEALQEHIGGLQVALKLTFQDVYGKPAIGTPAYHLCALSDYSKSLFQQLILLLPEEWERTEGD